MALGLGGAVLPLSGRTVTAAPGTGSYRVFESEYWLEWDEPVIFGIQQQLRAARTMSVRAMAERLGMASRLIHPELLDDRGFGLEEELVPEWRPSVVGASVDYAVHLPPELEPYLA